MRRTGQCSGNDSGPRSRGPIAALTLVALCAACKPQFGSFLPANAHFERTFGQLYEEAGQRKLSHYVIVKVPPVAVRTVSSGTIDYLPNFADMGNCVRVHPRRYPISLNDFSGLHDLPSPASVDLLYCHLEESSVRAAARVVYQRAFPNESATDWDAAAAHFIARDEGFEFLDVRDELLPTPVTDELGKAVNNELYFAVARDDGPERFLFVNPLPYLAAAVPALSLDAVKPAMSQIIVQTSASGFLANDIVDHVVSGGTIATALPRHPMRIAIRSDERAAGAGAITVPYRYHTRLELLSGTPGVRSRGAAQYNAFLLQDSIELAARAYDFEPPGESDPQASQYFPFVAWHGALPAPAEGNDFFNALTIPGSFVLDLNRVTGGAAAFPGGQYRLTLTVADVAQKALEQTINFTLEPGVEMQVAEDTDPMDAVSGDRPVDFLRIGLWDEAFDDPDTLSTLRNGPDPGNFVARDKRRFHLRIRDNAANTSAGSKQTIQARIGVFDDASGSIVDPLNDVRLTETEDNSGVFASPAQMLTALPNDPNATTCSSGEQECEDDLFWAHDGSNGLVADEAPGDRTHRAGIDDHVRIEYHPVGAVNHQVWKIPVCQRNPDARRRVWLRATIFDDVVDVDEDRVLAEIRRANLGWAPACLEFSLREAIRTLPAPLDANGVSITADDDFSTFDPGNPAGDSDEKRVITAFRAAARNDVVEVFFVPNMSDVDAQGKADIPKRNNAGLGEKTFLFVRNARPAGFRILAHELGHALENGDRDLDNPSLAAWFYPQRGLPLLDKFVWANRRISVQTIDLCTTVRSGGRDNPGNRLMQPY